MMMKWIAGAMLMLAVAVSTVELTCVASERTVEAPAASASPSSEPTGPDLPSAFELEDGGPSSMPVLTH